MDCFWIKSVEACSTNPLSTCHAPAPSNVISMYKPTSLKHDIFCWQIASPLMVSQGIKLIKRSTGLMFLTYRTLYLVVPSYY